MSGPPRTPTATLKLHGSRLVKEREAKEPKPPTGKPTASVTLTRPERRIYDKTCGLIKSMGLQAKTDGNAIARYAKNLARYNAVCKFMETHGEFYEGKVGVVRWPQSRIRTELETTLLRLEREFGLTPSARASLEVEQDKATSYADEFLA